MKNSLSSEDGSIYDARLRWLVFHAIHRHVQSRRITRRQVEQILRRLAYGKLYANSIRAGSSGWLTPR